MSKVLFMATLVQPEPLFSSPPNLHAKNKALVTFLTNSVTEFPCVLDLDLVSDSGSGFQVLQLRFSHALH